MTMKEYDPQEYDIVFGPIGISGWADGEFLSIEQVDDTFTTVEGTDGDVTRSKRAGRRVKAMIKTMQTSGANVAMSALHEVDRATPGGAGVQTLLVKDKQGTTVFAAAKAWITKMPDQGFDRTATSREWPIECTDVTMLVGGN